MVQQGTIGLRENLFRFCTQAVGDMRFTRAAAGTVLLHNPITFQAEQVRPHRVIGQI